MRLAPRPDPTKPSRGYCCSCCCGRCGPRRSARSLRQSRPLATTHSNERPTARAQRVYDGAAACGGRTARSYSSVPPAGEGARPSHTLTVHGCERRARAVSLWVCRAVRSACERAHGNPVTARYLLLGHRVAQQVVWVLRTSATHAGAAHVWRHNSCTRCCASRRLESASTGAHSLTAAGILPSARTSVSVPARQRTEPEARR